MEYLLTVLAVLLLWLQQKHFDFCKMTDENFYWLLIVFYFFERVSNVVLDHVHLNLTYYIS